MQGPSAIALRQGGQGGALKYKLGVQVVCTIAGGAAAPAAWRKKTTLQGVFGDFGQVLEIHIQEDGTAIVEYDDHRDAQDAADSMNGKKIGGVAVDVKIRQENACGPGGKFLDDRVNEMTQKYGLDATSAARLVSAFKDRSRRGCNLDEDIKRLSDHLAASNKPSALVCMKLADLREGKPIGPCRFNGDRPRERPAERADEEPKERRAKSRSRDRRAKSRSRSRRRSRDKDDKKEQKRSRDRDDKKEQKRSRDRDDKKEPKRSRDRDDKKETKRSRDRDDKKDPKKSRRSSRTRSRSHSRRRR